MERPAIAEKAPRGARAGETSMISGVLIGRDYRGVEVIAAHEPVADPGLGIVAKIDLAEVRGPFIRAGVITGIIALVLTMAGGSVFFRVTNPVQLKLGKPGDNLQQALKEVKVLRGIMPICSYGKNIRDDGGYWNQVEVYIEDRSDADLSHSICPA